MSASNLYEQAAAAYPPMVGTLDDGLLDDQRTPEISFHDFDYYINSCFDQKSNNVQSYSNSSWMSGLVAPEIIANSHDQYRQQVAVSADTTIDKHETRVHKGKERKQRTSRAAVVPDVEKDSNGKSDGEHVSGVGEGCVYVRARRGQATDSHSLAERVRRQRISEKMKRLQALIPGCDKVTGKTQVLDEIINYVQSLQSQVETKLAVFDPEVDLDFVSTTNAEKSYASTGLGSSPMPYSAQTIVYPESCYGDASAVTSPWFPLLEGHAYTI